MNHPRRATFLTIICLIQSIAIADSNLDALIAARAAAATRLTSIRQNGVTEMNERQKRLDRLKRDIETSTNQLAQQKEQHQARETRRLKTQETANNNATYLTNWSEQATAILRSTRERIERGIPFNRENRLKRLAKIELALTSRETAAAGITQLTRFIMDELILSRECRFIAEPVQLGDNLVQAYQIRSGLANIVFISEDGQTYGIWEDTAWRTELTDIEKQQIKTAVATCRGHQPPALLPLPIAAGEKR